MARITDADDRYALRCDPRQFRGDFAGGEAVFRCCVRTEGNRDSFERKASIAVLDLLRTRHQRPVSRLQRRRQEQQAKSKRSHDIVDRTH